MIAVTECRAHGLTPIIPFLLVGVSSRSGLKRLFFLKSTKIRRFSYDFTGKRQAHHPRSRRRRLPADGGVVTDGGRIVEVGKTTALRAKYPQAEFVDAKGGVIMPGLINAHTHIYSALARGLSINGYAPTNFYEVLDGQWWYIDRHLDLAATRPVPRPW